MFKARQEACGILFTTLKNLFLITAFQFEIRLKFLTAAGASHKHAPHVNWKAQLLTALSALLNSVFLHRLKRFWHHFTLKKELLPSEGIVII